MDQRHGQRQHLLLPARQILGILGQAAVQRGESLDRLLEATVDFGCAEFGTEKACPEVVFDRQSREGARPTSELHDPDPEAGLGLGVGDRPPVEPHDTPVGDPKPGDGPQQGRLPGAVGTEEGNDLPVGDIEIDVEEHLDRPVAEVEVANLHRRNIIGGGEDLRGLVLLFE